jgi:hypothetical protein
VGCVSVEVRIACKSEREIRRCLIFNRPDEKYIEM